MQIKAIIWEEDGAWCGSIPALKGCHTWGDSYEHLLEMLQEAALAWLEVANEIQDIEANKQLVELSTFMNKINFC